MQCEIRLDPRQARQWVATLVAEMRRRGHDVGLRAVVDPGGRSVAATIVAAVEPRLYGGPRPVGGRLGGRLGGAALDPHDWAPLVVSGDRPADLIIDLTGHALVSGAGHLLVATVDGASPEAGIAAALLARRPPRIRIMSRDASGDRLVGEGMPAVPEAAVFIRGYETVAARLVTLLVQSVERIARGEAGVIAADEEPAARPGVLSAPTFIAATLVEKIRLKLRRRRSQADRWTVGWREVDDDAVVERLAWPAKGYHWLPDDGLRYYADPFVFAHDGRRYLFVEEYVYATRRGHLSVAEWTGDGWTSPRPVLERPYHLSWPRVFFHDGEIYMLPETSEVHTLELYRAVAFPFVWELASVPATDIVLADATMLARDDGVWMLAGIVDRPGASSWDGLAVLHATGPLEPFRLVSDGACLVDAAAARPAGDIVRVGADWRRPVQDCTLGYGSALGIARIDQLDEGGFRQTLLARLAPDPAWNAIGVHTLNCADGIEVIDVNRGFDIRRRPPLDPRLQS